MCCPFCAASGNKSALRLQRTADYQLAPTASKSAYSSDVQDHVFERREVEAQDDVAMAAFAVWLPPQVGADHNDPASTVVGSLARCSSCPAATPSRSLPTAPRTYQTHQFVAFVF